MSPRAMASPAERVVDVIAHLGRMRDINARILDACIQRIFCDLSREWALPDVVTPSDAPPRFSTSIVDILRVLPGSRRRFRAQWRHLRVSLAGPESRAVAVAVAPARMASLRGGIPRRRELAAFLRPLNPNAPSPLQGIVSSSDVLLLCDPFPQSRLWDRAEDDWSERTYVIDTSFLAFLCWSSPAAAIGTAAAWLSAVASFVRARLAGRAVTLRSVLGGTSITRGLRILWSQATHLRGVLVTSNSFATEVMRWELLGEPRCERVIEVLHGVPDLAYERYLADISSVPGQSALQIVEQLPGVVTERSGAAVNGAFNEWCRHHGDVPGAEEYVTKAARTVLTGSTEGTFVVSFIGGFSVDKDHLTSRAFACERMLLSVTLDTLAASRVPHAVLYSPHPNAPAKRFRQFDEFRSGRVTLIDDTILGHLLGCCSVGLFSGALFEAAYFGNPVYAPVRESDAFYAPRLLNRLGLPRESDGTIAAQLRAFLRQQLAAPIDDAADRARRRLACLPLEAALRTQAGLV